MKVAAKGGWSRESTARNLFDMHDSLRAGIPSVQWLKDNHVDLYSAIQYYFKEDAEANGISRFHAACKCAGIDYYKIARRNRSPK